MTFPDNRSLAEIDKERLFHPVSSIHDIQKNGPSVYVSGEGVYLTDSAGKKSIDMGAGLWCVNVGYGRQELADAASRSIKELSFQHLFGGASSEPAIRLADRLLTLFQDTTPGASMARVFFGNSGSDANDTAIKLVRYYNNLRGRPRKKKIVSRIGAYHGVTLGSGSLTGISSYHQAFDLPMEGVLHTACPHYYAYGKKDESETAFTDRLISELEAMIEQEGPETIAAFIAEPVMGTGGVFLPPEGYFAKLQTVLDRFDILLIADEVITGFGRIGHWFGCGAYGLRPDIVSLAKGLTSAYFPMSASLVSERIWSVLSEASVETGPFMHGFTYSGHPVGAAIAMANLDLIEREGLVENAAERGRELVSGLKAALGDHPYIGDIRGVGLMAAIEFIADPGARTPFPAGAAPHKMVAKQAVEEGVLVRALPYLPVTSFSPPLTIKASEITAAVERYAKAVSAATPELRELIR